MRDASCILYITHINNNIQIQGVNMLDIKLVYYYNESPYLYWKENLDGNQHHKKSLINPIREIYINGVQYKKHQIKEVYREEFLELCRKMDKYLRKKDSIFSSGELDIVKAYNTYPYKGYKLVSYEVVGKFVSIELQVS